MLSRAKSFFLSFALPLPNITKVEKIKIMSNFLMILKINHLA
jgi:hypothetical protein